MAINKARTSWWMKAILILIVVAFVTSFISIVASPFAGKTANNQQQTTPQANSAEQINAEYQPQVQALSKVLASEPTSYTILVSLGNAYFDWAAKMQSASQTTTSAAGAETALWAGAKDAYSKAVKVKPGDSGVSIDYAVATFYSGDAPGAIAIAEGVTAADPKFAPAWYNLGVFYEYTGDNTKAIADFEKYLQLDPSGKQGNATVARERVAKLKAGK